MALRKRCAGCEDIVHEQDVAEKREPVLTHEKSPAHIGRLSSAVQTRLRDGMAGTHEDISPIHCSGGTGQLFSNDSCLIVPARKTPAPVQRDRNDGIHRAEKIQILKTLMQASL